MLSWAAPPPVASAVSRDVHSRLMARQRFTSLDFALMILLAVLALIGGLVTAWVVNERIPHLEDEAAYIFQARVFARGALWAPVPLDPSPFFTPFVVTTNGHRIGKYPVGWPLILAIGEFFNAGWVVNPILGAATVAVIYAFGRDLFDRQLGVMAAILALTSPFLLISSSNFMSHAASALWAGLLAYAFLRIEMAEQAGSHDWGWAFVMGFSIGMMVITRPLTAAAITLPFALLLGVRLFLSPREAGGLLNAYWPAAAAAILVSLVQPLFLYAVTGNPTTNLYLLIWPYDRVGFGPGYGPLPGGHSLRQALYTASRDLRDWSGILFGLPGLSWLPVLSGMVFGAQAFPRERQHWPWLLLSVFIALVGVYLAYWIGAAAYGPRYYYEAQAALCVLGAAGIRGLVHWGGRLIGWQKAGHKLASGAGSSRAAYALLAGLVATNLLFYLPGRLARQVGLYEITRAPLDLLVEIAESNDVLVLVRGGRWHEYAAFFSANTPWYDGPIVAAHDVNLTRSIGVIAMYPDREVWFYAEGAFSQAPAPYVVEESP